MSTLSASAHSRPRAAAAERGVAAVLRGLAISLATAIVILALAILPLLTPAWIHPALSAAGGQAAGVTLGDSLALSDLTVAELLFGPGTFAITYDGGRALYGADEIGHMQDVRLVLLGFLGLAVLAAAFVVWSLVRRRGQAAAWRAVARGSLGLAVCLVVLGVVAALAFSVAFELFHRILFPGGNWSFDPAQSNLVSLYPLGFWQLSAAAYGVLAIAAGIVMWLVARARARAGEG